MLAPAREDGGTTRFKGFGVSRTPYSLSRFSCRGCANQCEIRKVQVEGEPRAAVLRRALREKDEVDERRSRGGASPDLVRAAREAAAGRLREPEAALAAGRSGSRAP